MEIGDNVMEHHEKKLDIKLKPISKKQALDLVREYHYSNTLPNLNKLFLGIFIDGLLSGCITLGYGTRPKHTIKKLFPSLNTEDYLEIGRMCIDDKFKTNTESQMLSKCIKYLKRNYPSLKVLFTWSDGILGKCGTVYQASNFLYGGYIFSDIYIYNGIKVHPRLIKKLINPSDKRKTVRPTPQQKKELGIEHIRGKQFRYCYFLCGFSEKKRLIKESPFDWNTNYPTQEDCVWEKWVAPYTYIPCNQPIISSDNIEELNQRNLDQYFGD